MNFLKIILSLCFFTLVAVASGQTINKGKGAINKESFSYFYIEPEHDVKGVLILLPGLGESPQSIFEKTALPRLLAEKGFLTIVPQMNQTLFADDYTIAQINDIISIQTKRYNSIDLDIFIGGLSAGGAVAIGYAEHVLGNDSSIKLKGVFGIDPPLDLRRMYVSAENKIRYNCRSKLIRKEGTFIKRYLLSSMSGTPEERPDQYIKYSAFSASAEDGGNARLLKTIPIRLYTEPDLQFVRKTYCQELQYEDINAVDLEKLSSFLVSIGNRKVEYITTKGKGFHSWNILDPADCANWIIDIANRK